MKDRELRYQSASDLRADLKRLKRDATPVSHAAASSSDPVQRPSAIPKHEPAPASTTVLIREAKRHRVAVAVAVALLLALVSAAALGIYSLLQREAATTAPGQDMTMTPLTDSGDVTGCVNISPDGKHVVYCTGGGGGSTWVKQVATGATIKLADRFAGDTTFSRDSNVIYVRRNSETGGRLMVIPALGGEPREVLTRIQGPVAVSPDGKQFAFVRPGAGNMDVVLANADGSGERTLHAGRIAESWVTPGLSWSADGRSIAAPRMSRDAGLQASPVVLDVATGRLQRLTADVWETITRVAWLHDGSGIVFAATAAGDTNCQLWLVEYPGGQWRRITNDLHNYAATGLGITSDDSTIVANQSADDGKVWVADAAGEHAVAVTKGSGSHRVLGWTSGNRVLYRSTAPVDSLWTVGVDGSEPRRQPIDLSDRIEDISLAPGRDWIVYTVSRRDGADVWRTNLDGRGRVRLTHEGINRVPRVTPDGGTVIFARPEAGRPSLWKVPSAGGEAVRITGNFVPGAISPDGQRVAGRAPGPPPRPSLDRLADGSLEPIVTADRDAVAGIWTPDGKSMVLITTDTTERGRVGNLWAYPLDGSAPRQLTRFGNDRIFSFAYSPDGTRLALSRGRLSGDVVLIKNFR